MTTYVSPSLPRYALEERNELLSVFIKLDDNKILLILPIIIFVIMSIGLGYIYYLAFTLIYSTSSTNSIPIIMYIGLIVWVTMGLILSIVYIWRLTLKIEMDVSRNEIVITHKSLIINQTKHYSAEHIKDLRASNILPTSFWTGTIAFDYRARTIRFGAILDEAEAKQIIAKIIELFPQYDH